MASEEVKRVYASLSLSPPLPEGQRPVLIILTGLPGSGKTHLARALCRRIPITLIGSDPVRSILFENPRYTPAENAKVYSLVNALIWQLLCERRHVIYDAVNLSEYRRQELRILALDTGARPLTVFTIAPPTLIQQRLARRQELVPQPGDSEADWSVYTTLAPRLEPIRHQHIIVNTAQNIEPALDAIIQRIDELSG